MKIEVSKSYIVGKEIKNISYTIKTVSDFTTFKNNVKTDADFYAQTRKGKISFQETDKSLFVSYLDVPGCLNVDSIYLLNDNRKTHFKAVCALLVFSLLFTACSQSFKPVTQKNHNYKGFTGKYRCNASINNKI